MKTLIERYQTDYYRDRAPALSAAASRADKPSGYMDDLTFSARRAQRDCYCQTAEPADLDTRFRSLVQSLCGPGCCAISAPGRTRASTSSR